MKNFALAAEVQLTWLHVDSLDFHETILKSALNKQGHVENKLDILLIACSMTKKGPWPKKNIQLA